MHFSLYLFIVVVKVMLVLVKDGQGICCAFILAKNAMLWNSKAVMNQPNLFSPIGSMHLILPKMKSHGHWLHLKANKIAFSMKFHERWHVICTSNCIIKNIMYNFWDTVCTYKYCTMYIQISFTDTLCTGSDFKWVTFFVVHFVCCTAKRNSANLGSIVANLMPSCS